MGFWIDHPACQDQPVSLSRWLMFHLSEVFRRWSSALEFRALHGRPYDDEIDLPF